MLDRILGRTPVAPVSEAVIKAPARIPERQGFEYGVPKGGLTEWSAGIGASTGSDRRSTLTQLYEAYLACPWASACVNTIARTITAGGLDIDFDTDDGEGDQEVPAEPEAVARLRRLLDYVNPREDIRQLLRGVIVDLLVFGDAYLEVIWLAGEPVALYSLDAPSVFPIADEHGVVSKYVQVTELGQRAEFTTDEVIHISLDDPRSGLYGVSPTQMALLPITIWLFCAATLKETFRKGDPADIHVDFPAAMNEAEVKRWAAQYQARNVGPRNIGTPIMTKGGAHIQEMREAKLGEYLQTLNQKRDEICSAYGTPPAKVGIIESGNLGGGTGEGQDKSFRVNTCGPIAELVLEKLNFHIVARGFGIEGWHLAFGEFDWRDSKIVEEIRDMRLRNGSWTLNRYRNEINEPPVDGGDDAVLVDRQNLVLWADITAMSKAMVLNNSTALAAQLGIELPTGPAMTPTPPPGNDQGEPGEPPPGGTDKDAQPGDAATAATKAKETSFAADVRSLGEAWQHTYRTRLEQALRKAP